MSRLEFKYLVRLEDLDALRKALLSFLDPDPFTPSGSNEYTVRSVYLDTFGLDDYYEKESGVQHRQKVRVRGYNEQSLDTRVFLEIKRKDNMAIAKVRASVRFKDLRSLLESGDVERYVPRPEAREEARRFLFHIYRHSRKPMVLIQYEREAYFYRFDSSVRLTLDKNLRSLAFPELEDVYEETRTRLSFPGHFLLEVKFSKGVPSWFKGILHSFGLERTSFSKYCESLDFHGIPESCSRARLFSNADPIGSAASLGSGLPDTTSAPTFTGTFGR
jgi:hypothetical protein